jgi:hypothetical protein
MPGLRMLLLTEDEWQILGEIADILEVRIHLTTRLNVFLNFNVSAVHRGDITDVARQNTDNPLRLTTVSQDGDAS